MVQGELFREESSSYLDNLDSKAKRSFLSKYQFDITLDKLLLALIGMLVIFVLTYCFGVEHGKQSIEKRLQTLMPVHSETLPVTTLEGNSLKEPAETVLLMKKNTPALAIPATLEASEEMEVEAKVEPKITQQPVEQASNLPKPASSLPVADLTRQDAAYTVQLVTYDKENMAAREIERLKAKGHEGFVITSGRYFQVCANYFENHSKARSFLKQFRESGRYPDAFIRPVAR